MKKNIQRLQNDMVLQVHQFLPKEQAVKLHRQLSLLPVWRHWCLLSTPDRPYTRLKFERNRVFSEKQRLKVAKKAYHRKQFSFNFYRTVDQNLHIIKSFLQELSKFLVEHLNIDAIFVDCFAAKFANEQFIARHTDNVRGRYAFIFQLSKAWQVKNGGELMLYPKSHRFYAKRLIPQFNCLTLLKLSKNSWHEVKKVTTTGNKDRITITGWIK